MPIVFVYTNVPRADIPATFLPDVTNASAEILGTDPQKIQVVVNADCLMAFGGSTEPTAAALVLSASGVLTPDANDGVAARFTEVIPARLGVSKERFYMTLNSLPRHVACYMGSTLASLKE